MWHVYHIDEHIHVTLFSTAETLFRVTIPRLDFTACFPVADGFYVALSVNSNVTNSFIFLTVLHLMLRCVKHTTLLFVGMS
jgi:hypothetical protein